MPQFQKTTAVLESLSEKRLEKAAASSSNFEPAYTSSDYSTSTTTNGLTRSNGSYSSFSATPYTPGGISSMNSSNSQVSGWPSSYSTSRSSSSSNLFSHRADFGLTSNKIEPVLVRSGSGFFKAAEPEPASSLEAEWNTSLEEQRMILAKIEAEAEAKKSTVKRSRSLAAANFSASRPEVEEETPKRVEPELLIPFLETKQEEQVRF